MPKKDIIIVEESVVCDRPVMHHRQELRREKVIDDETGPSHDARESKDSGCTRAIVPDTTRSAPIGIDQTDEHSPITTSN